MAYQTHQKKLPQTVHKQRERKPAMIIPQPLPPRVMSAEVSIPQAHSKPAAPPATVITRSVPNQGTPPSNIRGVTSPRIKNIPVISRAVVPRENTPRLTIKTKKTPNRNPTGVWQYPKISLQPLPSLPRDVPGIIKSPILMVPSTITRNMQIKQETDAVRMQALRKAYALASRSYNPFGRETKVDPAKLREAAAWVDIYNQELARPSRTLADLNAVEKNIAENNRRSDTTALQRIRNALENAWGNGKAIGSDILYYLAAPAISALGHGGGGEAANSVVNRVAFEAANKLIPERYRGIVTLGDVFRTYNPQELQALLPTNIEHKIATAMAEGLGDILADIGQDPKGAQLSARSKLQKPTTERKLLLQTMFRNSALPNKNKLAALGMNAMLRAGEHFAESLPDAIGPLRINRPQLLRVWNEDITSRFAPETIKFASDLRNAKYEGLRILPAQIPKDNRIQITIPSLDANPDPEPFEDSREDWDEVMRYNQPPRINYPDPSSMPKNEPNISIPIIPPKGNEPSQNNRYEMEYLSENSGNEEKEVPKNIEKEKDNALSQSLAWNDALAKQKIEEAEALMEAKGGVDDRPLSRRVFDALQDMENNYKYQNSSNPALKKRYIDAKNSYDALRKEYDTALNNWINTRLMYSMKAAKEADLYKYLPNIDLDSETRKQYEKLVEQYHLTRLEDDALSREYQNNVAYAKAKSAIKLQDLEKRKNEEEKAYKKRYEYAEKFTKDRENWKDAYNKSIVAQLWGLYGKYPSNFNYTNWETEVLPGWTNDIPRTQIKPTFPVEGINKKIAKTIEMVINKSGKIEETLRKLNRLGDVRIGNYSYDDAIKNLKELVYSAQKLHQENVGFADKDSNGNTIYNFPTLEDSYTGKSRYEATKRAYDFETNSLNETLKGLKKTLDDKKSKNSIALNETKKEITQLINTAREKNKMSLLPEINLTSYLPTDAPTKEPTFFEKVRESGIKIKDTISNAIDSLKNNYESATINNPNPETGNLFEQVAASSGALAAIGVALGMSKPLSLQDVLGGDRVIPDNAPVKQSYAPIMINPRGVRTHDAPIAVLNNPNEYQLNRALGNYFAANNPLDPNDATKWSILDTIQHMFGMQPKINKVEFEMKELPEGYSSDELIYHNLDQNLSEKLINNGNEDNNRNEENEQPQSKTNESLFGKNKKEEDEKKEEEIVSTKRTKKTKENK